MAKTQNYSKFVIWLLPIGICSGYLACSPAISVLVSGMLFNVGGFPAAQLSSAYRNVWYALILILLASAFYAGRPWPIGFWRILAILRRRSLLGVVVFLHIIFFQILIWQTASACEALQLPVPAESLENGLLIAYAPPMALSWRLFGYQQYDPGSVFFAIAFSITVYSVIFSVILIIVIRWYVARVVPSGVSLKVDINETAISRSPAFDLVALQTLRDAGKITPEEFKRLRLIVLGQQKPE